MFAILPPAVPTVCKLSLYVFCGDAALYSFGLFCPGIVKLKVDTSTVPLKALQDFGRHLPQLVSISLTGHTMDSQNNAQVSAYIDSFLRMTSQCLPLKHLKINILSSDEAQLQCKPRTWKKLPAKLESFSCSCDVDGSVAFQKLICRIPRLGLYQVPRDSLFELIDDFPAHKSFKVLEQTDDALFVNCRDMQESDSDVSNQLSLTKERFLTGLFLAGCWRIAFCGTSSAVSEVFKWLSPFPDVRCLSRELEGQNTPQFLGQVQHLFPKVEVVHLDGPRDADPAEGSIKLLRPLLQIAEAPDTHFTLDLKCPHFALTALGLGQLCSNSPTSKEFRLAHWMCGGMDADQFEEQFQQGDGTCDLTIN